MKKPACVSAGQQEPAGISWRHVLRRLKLVKDGSIQHEQRAFDRHVNELLWFMGTALGTLLKGGGRHEQDQPRDMAARVDTPSGGWKVPIMATYDKEGSNTHPLERGEH